MRVLYLSDFWTFIMCVIVWFFLQVGATLLCLYLPDHFFSPDLFLFRTHEFEQEGRIYEKYFFVKKWKHLLPDGGKAFKDRGFSKKHISGFTKENLYQFLVESCRGEMTHWLPILFFWVFWLFTPWYVPFIMLVYALITNLPCIIVQRYNRPRINKILNRKNKKISA